MMQSPVSEHRAIREYQVPGVSYHGSREKGGDTYYSVLYVYIAKLCPTDGGGGGPQPSQLTIGTEESPSHCVVFFLPFFDKCVSPGIVHQ